jgi:hypothetical protein
MTLDPLTSTRPPVPAPREGHGSASPAPDSERGRAAQLYRPRPQIEDLLANVPGVVWEAFGTPDALNVDFVSNYVERMLGYSVREWLERPDLWLTVVPPR